MTVELGLAKYLQTISTIKSFPTIDPGNIYVENVRSILNVDKLSATLICEMGVQEKVFIKKIGLVCSNDGRIIQQFDSLNEIPDEITCDICEMGEEDVYTFKTSELEKIEFYQLNKLL